MPSQLGSDHARCALEDGAVLLAAKNLSLGATRLPARAAYVAAADNRRRLAAAGFAALYGHPLSAPDRSGRGICPIVESSRDACSKDKSQCAPIRIGNRIVNLPWISPRPVRHTRRLSSITDLAPRTPRTKAPKKYLRPRSSCSSIGAKEGGEEFNHINDLEGL